MSGASGGVHVGQAIPIRPPRRALHGSDFTWSLAFIVPYAAMFAAFAAYPIVYALWMGAKPSLAAALFADPRYLRAVLNTVVFAAVAVNLQMALALMLSGFFARPRRWIKLLLVIYLLPWTLPAVPAYLSFHWMLVTRQGLPDRLLATLFGIQGPFWLGSGALGLGCDIAAAVWKWLPLWTLILLGGRMAIPRDLYDAAALDGASSWQRFTCVSVPLLANLYLISTLISAVWTVGDYLPVLFVSGGGPAFASSVVSTLGFSYAFDFSRPALGVAAGLSMLPVLLPILLLLLRALRRSEVRL